jgi:pilus assembly protein Flp/PilA
MLFLERERGQGLMEYGLVLVLVAVVIVAILTVLGPQIGNMFSRIIVCVPPTDLC